MTEKKMKKYENKKERKRINENLTLRAFSSNFASNGAQRWSTREVLWGYKTLSAKDYICTYIQLSLSRVYVCVCST